MRTRLSLGLRRYLEEYAGAHRSPVNQALHYAGIPALMVAALGLLSKVAARKPGRPQLARPDAAWPVLAAGGVWYLSLDRPVGLPTSAAFLAAYAVGRSLRTRTLLGLLGLGAVAHTVGHYRFEHKPPAFLSHPLALLEAPAWLVARWSRRFP